MPPAPEPETDAAAGPPASSGPASGRFLDDGPCLYPGCSRVGPRVCGQLCPPHTLSVLGEVYDRPAAAPAADPIEAGVRAADLEAEASRRRRWWREDDPHCVEIVLLCLDFYRQGKWPIKHHPTAPEISRAWAVERGFAPDQANPRKVNNMLLTASRRTGRPQKFTAIRADALNHFTAECGAAPEVVEKS